MYKSLFCFFCVMFVPLKHVSKQQKMAATNGEGIPSLYYSINF
jgi:hypothetical protein